MGSNTLTASWWTPALLSSRASVMSKANLSYLRSMHARVCALPHQHHRWHPVNMRSHRPCSCSLHHLSLQAHSSSACEHFLIHMLCSQLLGQTEKDLIEPCDISGPVNHPPRCIPMRTPFTKISASQSTAPKRSMTRSAGPPAWRSASQSSGTVKLRRYHIRVTPTSPRPIPARSIVLHVSMLLRSRVQYRRENNLRQSVSSM